MNNLLHQRGFSLLELMVVILVVAALISLGGVKYQELSKKTNNSEATIVLNALIKSFTFCMATEDLKTACGNLPNLIEAAFGQVPLSSGGGQLVYKDVSIDSSYIGTDSEGRIELKATHNSGSMTQCYDGNKFEMFSVPFDGTSPSICGNGMSAGF